MIYLLKSNWLNKSREQTQRSEVEECAPPKGKRVNIWYCYRELGFPAGASGKEPACQCRRHNRRRFDPWVGKIPWRRKQHSSVLSWRIPWTEEPGGLQSMRSQRVRHDCDWAHRSEVGTESPEPPGSTDAYLETTLEKLGFRTNSFPVLKTAAPPPPPTLTPCPSLHPGISKYATSGGGVVCSHFTASTYQHISPNKQFPL